MNGMLGLSMQPLAAAVRLAGVSVISRRNRYSVTYNGMPASYNGAPVIYSGE